MQVLVLFSPSRELRISKGSGRKLDSSLFSTARTTLSSVSSSTIPSCGPNAPRKATSRCTPPLSVLFNVGLIPLSAPQGALCRATPLPESKAVASSFSRSSLARGCPACRSFPPSGLRCPLFPRASLLPLRQFPGAPSCLQALSASLPRRALLFRKVQNQLTQFYELRLQWRVLATYRSPCHSVPLTPN
jgi:hypothetical protein